MLQLTDAAKLVLHSALVDRGVPPDVAFRLSRTADGTRLTPDRAAPEDTSYRIAGRTVLIVARDVTKEMSGQALDVVRTDRGDQFLLRRAGPRNLARNQGNQRKQLDQEPSPSMAARNPRSTRSG